MKNMRNISFLSPAFLIYEYIETPFLCESHNGNTPAYYIFEQFPFLLLRFLDPRF